MTMSSAEFLCQRELLGLPINWLAGHLGVSRRSVSRWEAGTAPVPDEAAQQMRSLVERAEQAVGYVTVKVMNDPAMSHTTFREDWGMDMPASWHRMVTARAAERTKRRIEWAQ